MSKYQITIGYRAIICVDIKADNEEEAKEKGLKLFEDKERKKWFKGNGIELQDDSYQVNGTLNIEETWDMIY